MQFAENFSIQSRIAIYSTLPFHKKSLGYKVPPVPTVDQDKDQAELEKIREVEQKKIDEGWYLLDMNSELIIVTYAATPMF